MKVLWLTLGALFCLVISSMAVAGPCDHAWREGGRPAYERCMERHRHHGPPPSRHHRGPGPGRDFVADRCFERYGRSPRFHDCVRYNRSVVNRCESRYGRSPGFRDCVHRHGRF